MIKFVSGPAPPICRQHVAFFTQQILVPCLGVQPLIHSRWMPCGIIISQDPVPPPQPGRCIGPRTGILFYLTYRNCIPVPPYEWYDSRAARIQNNTEDGDTNSSTRMCGYIAKTPLIYNSLTIIWNPFFEIFY